MRGPRNSYMRYDKVQKAPELVRSSRRISSPSAQQAVMTTSGGRGGDADADAGAPGQGVSPTRRAVDHYDPSSRACIDSSGLFQWGRPAGRRLQAPLWKRR
jgi:hypothetical protein